MCITQHTHTLIVVYVYMYYNIYAHVCISQRIPLNAPKRRDVHKAPPKKLNFDNPLAFRAFKQTITRAVRRISDYIIIIILCIRAYIITTYMYIII